MMGEQGGVRAKHDLSLLAIIMTSAIVTIALYVPGLHLPFYSDDLVQLPWLRTISLGALWRSVSPYGYYRPLAFSIWLVWRDLGLPLIPAALRTFNLVGHILASILVGRLAHDLVRDYEGVNPALSGIFGAALFVAFPFSYQAVLWISAIFYPLVTILSVLAVLAYRQVRHSRRWLILCAMATGLVPFAHETGMLVGLLLLSAGLIDRLTSPPAARSKHRELLLAAFGLLILNLIAAIVWFQLREGGITTLDLSIDSLLGNANMLVLGLSYPSAPLAPPLSRLGIPTAVSVWVLALLTLGLSAWAIRRVWPVGLLGLAWFFLSLVPVLVTMRPEWLADAPRFLYPAAVGAALWWGAVVGQLAGTDRAWRMLAVVLGLVAVVPGTYFAHQGVNWYLRGGAAIWDAVRAAQEQPNQPLLLVNLPDRLAADRSLYPYFDGGAILLPARVEPGAIIGTHLGTQRPRDIALTAGQVLPQVNYRRSTYGPQLSSEALIALIESGRPVYMADYTDDNIRLQYVGGRMLNAELTQQPIAYFSDSIILWGSEAFVETNKVYLRLTWELSGSPAGSPTVFVHVVDANDQIVAQADGDPLGGLYPMSAHRDRLILEDIRAITLPGEESYTIYVGVWLPASGQRLPVVGRDDYIDGRVPVAHVNADPPAQR